MPVAVRVLVLRVLVVVTFVSTGLLTPSNAAGQESPQTDPVAPPAFRRWVDVDQLQVSSRYRWVETTDGMLTSSSIQWQPQLRAHVPIDPSGRYALHVGAFGGSSFVSGWNNTGAGIGQYAGAFNVKQLFVAAEPLRGVHLSAGGLYLLRGESTEITSYDTDGYIVGERAMWQSHEGAVSQVALTTGYFGDLREPNVFHRLDRLDEWNYEQLLIGWRFGKYVVASTDYTHESGRDTVREAVTVRLPARVKVISGVKLDVYERVSPDTARGMNVSADLRPFGKLGITAGYATIDREYGGLNADRYDRGNRLYFSGAYSVSDALSIGWFCAEAVANDYVLANEHRFDIVVTINPTGSLRRRRVF